jgi:hypothetical protein
MGPRSGNGGHAEDGHCRERAQKCAEGQPSNGISAFGVGDESGASPYGHPDNRIEYQLIDSCFVTMLANAR